MRGVVLSGVFFISWFLAFLCLLPVGLGGGHDPDTGAPLSPRLGFKFLLATVIATAAFVVFYGVVLMGWIDI